MDLRAGLLDEALECIDGLVTCIELQRPLSCYHGALYLPLAFLKCLDFNVLL